jgi:hypothetical protein
MHRNGASGLPLAADTGQRWAEVPDGPLASIGSASGLASAAGEAVTFPFNSDYSRSPMCH